MSPDQILTEYPDNCMYCGFTLNGKADIETAFSGLDPEIDHASNRYYRDASGRCEIITTRVNGEPWVLIDWTIPEEEKTVWLAYWSILEAVRDYWLVLDAQNKERRSICIKPFQ